MGLTGSWREIPKTDLETLLDSFEDADIREVLEELIGEPPRRDPEPLILVHLCLDLLRSGDFAEIEATDEELGRELHAALADAPRTLDDPFDRHPPMRSRRRTSRCPPSLSSKQASAVFWSGCAAAADRRRMVPV
jgi:hypothetical protein